MIWYGESYALDWGAVISGTPFDFSLLSFHYDTDHHVMAAGESFTIGSYLDTAYWTEFGAFTDPIEMRWVIEVNGGTGSLQLNAGADPDEAYTNTSLATQNLGTITVTGPATIVSEPITGVTKADLEAYSTYPFVWIQCIGGTVDIQQVKMRVWPTAGPSGDWSTAGATSFTGVGSGTRIRAQKGQVNGGPTSEAAAWSEVVAILDSFDGASLPDPGTIYGEPWGTGPELPVCHMNVGFDTGSGLGYRSNVYTNVAILTPYGNEASVYSIPTYSSTGYDPREIKYETLGRVRAIGGGPVLPTITALSITATGTDSAYIAMEAITAADRDLAVSTDTYRYAPPSGAVALTDGVLTTLTPPGTGPVLVSVYAPTYFTNPGSSGGFRNSELTTLGMTCAVTYSGYEWFDPTLPWPVEAPPPAEQPGAGFYILPNPNLDGEGDGVQVYFASS